MATPQYGPQGPPGSDDADAEMQVQPSEHLPHEEMHTMLGHEGPVLAVRFNRQGTYCLSCGKDRTVRLWNPHRGVAIKTYTGHGHDVRDAAVVQDNSKFASCGGDRQVLLFDVPTGNVVRRWRGHDSVVNTLAWAPDGGLLASGGYDSFVRLWDGRSRSAEAVQSVKAAADSITGVLISDRAEIFACSVDGTLRRLDARIGRLIIDDLGAPVTHAALSHDGECLLAACTDGGLRLLDRGSGKLLAGYRGHEHTSTRVECGLTPSDAHVFAASEDGRICYWELVESQLVRSFQAHPRVVTSLALHPQGRCLVTSSVDGVIKVWE